MHTLEGRVLLLEKRLGQMWLIFLSVLVMVIVGAWVGHSVAASQQNKTVLRVRGIVIEDEQGRPRVLLGAPTPSVRDRNRTEPVNGMVLLGPSGADRIVISSPGLEPQVMGKVEKRRIPLASAGLLINDADGNERAGFGSSDDGTRVSLGMDYADRDAIGLLVSPNFSGFIAFARKGELNDQAAIAVLKDGTSTVKLANSDGDEGIIVEDRKDAPLRIQVQNSTTHKLEEVAPLTPH